jgi:hypothetical protein
MALLLQAKARAEIIISEIMFNPQGTDRDSTGADYTFNREWAELYNTGASAVDLSGWQYGDSADNNWASAFPAGTSIAPGQALVVTGDNASFDANWGTGINRIQVSAFPNQANSIGTNEIAAIRNAQGVIQDSVRYQETGWPTANGSDGNSIYLLPQALSSTANNIGSNWLPSSAGVYGAKWVNAGGQGENHGSPGFVATQQQSAFLPDANVAWSMVVMPDTQNYSKSTTNYPIFPQMTTWIKDNKQAFKIQLVMQEGDIVNRNDSAMPSTGELPSTQQWTNASNAMGVLDGQVPYIMAVGNHDLGTGENGTAENRNTMFNAFFPPSRNPLNDPAQGGILKGVFEPGHYENAYYEVHAPDGRNMLIFSLEFWPTDETVAWANRIASQPKYADYTASLITHSYLNWNDQRMDAVPNAYPNIGGDANDGQQLWEKLVSQNKNFEMTFSGHVGGDGRGYLKSTGVNGNKVNQMMINSQFETNGGNGWMRVLEFLNDGKTVHVRTYSPYFNLYRIGPEDDYFITLSQLPMTPGDFNADGKVDNLDLAAWQAGFGTASGAGRTQGDADGDGDVDGEDLLIWQQNRGLGAISATSNAVPEPATIQYVVVAAVLAAARLRRRTAAGSTSSGKRVQNSHCWTSQQCHPVDSEL